MAEFFFFFSYKDLVEYVSLNNIIIIEHTCQIISNNENKERERECGYLVSLLLVNNIGFNFFFLSYADYQVLSP